MRAVVIDATGGTDVLHTASLPVPSPVLSELLVRVVAAGINPIDAKTRGGAGVSAAIAGYPATLGYDFSGIVVRSPYETHPFPPGTPVFGMLPFPRSGGSYAAYAVVPSLSVARKPASLSHVEAAGVPLFVLGDAFSLSEAAAPKQLELCGTICELLGVAHDKPSCPELLR